MEFSGTPKQGSSIPFHQGTVNFLFTHKSTEGFSARQTSSITLPLQVGCQLYRIYSNIFIDYVIQIVSHFPQNPLPHPGGLSGAFEGGLGQATFTSHLSGILA